MHVFEATFEVVTPMFIGGYDTSTDKDYLSIRPPAIKGALRFWWRALNWARINQENPNNSLQALHREESALFGGAADKTHSEKGQSLVHVRLKKNVESASTDLSPNGNGLTYKSGCNYLLGLGLIGRQDRQTVLNRSFIKSGAEFTIQLAVKLKKTDPRIKQVEEALLIWGLLGGLGSRARRGWGSVVIKRMLSANEAIALPNDILSYKSILNALIKPSLSNSTLPPFTCFSAFTMIYQSAQGQMASDVLDIVGKKLNLYRGFGYNQNGSYQLTTGGHPIQKFSDDHYRLSDFAFNNNSTGIQPQRLIFGMPHNNTASQENVKKSIDIELDHANKSRRASPLFIHITKLNNQYFAIQSVLPAQFFPDRIHIGYDVYNGNTKPQPNTNRVSRPAEQVNWKVLYDYLTLQTFSGPAGEATGFGQSMALINPTETLEGSL